MVGQSPTLYSNAEQNCPQESFYSNQCFPSPLNGWNFWNLLFYGTRRTSSFVLVYVVYLSFWTFYAMGNVSSSHFSTSSRLKCEIGRLWSRQLTLVLCKYNQYVQNKWNSVQVKEYNPLSAKFVQKNFTLLELWWIQLCLTCSLLEAILLLSINLSTLEGVPKLTKIRYVLFHMQSWSKVFDSCLAINQQMVKRKPFHWGCRREVFLSWIMEKKLQKNCSVQKRNLYGIAFIITISQ